MAATYQSRNKGYRRGIAPIEFAMSLPILLLLVVGIIWLGYIVVGQSQVIIEARTKASAQRFEDKSKRPLIFPKLTSQAANPFYSAEDDYASDTVTKEVRVSRVYDHFATPKAKFTVLAGSWDHRALPFDEFPNIEKMAEVSLMGFGGDVLGLISKLNGFFDTVSSMGDQLEGQLTSRLTDALTSVGGGGIKPGEDSGISNQFGEGPQNSSNEEANRKAEAERIRDSLGGKPGVGPDGSGVVPTRPDGPLAQTIAEIKRLEGLASEQGAQQPGQPPKTPEEEQAQQEALESNERLLEMMRKKRERIEMDILSAEADLPKEKQT